MFFGKGLETLGDGNEQRFTSRVGFVGGAHRGRKEAEPGAECEATQSPEEKGATSAQALQSLLQLNFRKPPLASLQSNE